MEQLLTHPAADAAATRDVRRVVVSGDVLGESPVWDPRTGEVAWIDASEESALNTVDWGTGVHRRVSLPTRCTAIGLGATPGEYVAALGDGVGIIDRSGSVLANVLLESDPAVTITNDGACDPAGSFWFGTTTRTRTPLAGSLWRYDGSTVATVAAGYTLSNGIAWLPDASGFFHVDTFERIVRRDTWDPQAGRLDEAEFIVFAEDEGLPDGIALDTEGGLWIAFWGASEVRRYDPRGRVDLRVRLPVPNVTAVTFAGDDLSTLVATTARSTENGRPAEGSGDLYAYEVAVPGVEPMVFAW